jgi:hypothetical protein
MRQAPKRRTYPESGPEVVQVESFSSLMEFAVAIAGFSGITMAIQARSAETDEAHSFRNTNLIAWSLCAAFSCAIPQGCVHFGATGSQLWAWSSAAIALPHSLLLFLPFYLRSLMTLEGRAQLSRFIWIVGTGGNFLALSSQIANATGLFGDPSPAPLYLGIVWMIFMAALMYARMLIGLRQAPAA